LTENAERTTSRLFSFSPFPVGVYVGFPASPDLSVSREIGWGPTGTLKVPLGPDKISPNLSEHPVTTPPKSYQPVSSRGPRRDLEIARGPQKIGFKRTTPADRRLRAMGSSVCTSWLGPPGWIKKYQEHLRSCASAGPRKGSLALATAGVASVDRIRVRLPAPPHLSGKPTNKLPGLRPHRSKKATRPLGYCKGDG